MKGLTITTTTAATIEASFTADDWELFHEDGRDAAADDLNRALEAAVNATGATEASATAAMAAACARHADIGADDGEAEALAERAIARALGDR